MRNFLFALFVIAFCVSCSPYPSEVEAVLKISQNNRVELEKALNYFKNKGDEQKLNALYFLIKNMGNKHSIYWKNRNKYEELYSFVKVGSSNSSAKAKWDSLRKSNGIILERKEDIKFINSEFLIKSVELAFDTWKKAPWFKYYNFDQFCEYILPYRVDDEPLEDWRSYFKTKASWISDSIKTKSNIYEACKFINDYIDKHHKLIPTLKGIPKLGTVDSYNHPAGICEHRLILIVSILRAFGIPCAIDYTPQYTNWNGDHSWIALIDTTGHTVSFSGGDILKFSPTNKMPMGYGNWAATKVYRNTFSYDFKKYAKDSNNLILKNSWVDVTKEYDMHIGNVSFVVKNLKHEDIYLCTFGEQNNIQPVAYEQKRDSIVDFKNVGLNSLYFPAIFSENEIIPLQNPIFFDSLGKKIRYSPKQINQNVILTRKFPDDGSMKKYGEHILGSKIQGSNNPSFKNPINLHYVDSIPYHFISIYPNISKSFRYVKWLAPDSGFIRLAELEYYSKKSKLAGKTSGKNPDYDIPQEGFAKALDGSLYTWFDAPAKSWMTIDFGKPEFIEKIKYVQRSSLNYVEIGHLYELLYFDKGWKSLGQKQAIENHIEYNNAPLNSVFLLRDLSKGKQERIFIYENGKQSWK